MRNKLRLAGVAVAASVLAVTVGAAPALADPSGAPTFRDLAGVGSDTTQGVMDAMANVVVSPGGTGFPAAGTKLIASYDAVGASPIQTKATGCTITTRPNGSTAGRTALITSVQANDGCLQFSRSSSGPATGLAVPLTWVPFAIDAVTFAVSSTSNIPRQLSKNDLISIYNCSATGFNPYLPQAGSGTRNFFMTFLGLNPTTPPPCVKDTINGTPIEEHDGRVVSTDPNGIVPISIAQNIAQSNQAVNDIRGTSTLGEVDSNLSDPTNVPANDVSPVVINSGAAQSASTGWPIQREIYNIIPTANLTNVEIANVFVGANSQICQHVAIIKQFGFDTDPNCGSTSQHQP